MRTFCSINPVADTSSVCIRRTCEPFSCWFVPISDLICVESQLQPLTLLKSMMFELHQCAQEFHVGRGFPLRIECVISYGLMSLFSHRSLSCLNSFLCFRRERGSIAIVTSKVRRARSICDSEKFSCCRFDNLLRTSEFHDIPSLS